MDIHLWLRVLLVYHGSTQDSSSKEEEVFPLKQPGEEQHLHNCNVKYFKGSY